ncbi:MAG: amidohydrolase family protein [Actinobacteria bacterium]|nr:amidohydrolase family protein [Actinomycetota bacterium]
MPTMDGHAHVFKALSEHYPRAVHPMYPPHLEAPVEELLSTMQTHRVEKAILVALSPHDEYLGECLSSHPNRLAGIGVLDPSRSSDAEGVHRRFSESGLRGLRVHHLGAQGSTRAQELDAWPALQALSELEGIVWLYVPAEELELLPMALDHLPGLRVVINHLGWPLPNEFKIDTLGRPTIKGTIPATTLKTVLVLSHYANVHVMFSGQYAFSREDYPFADLGRVVWTIYKEYGAGRMIWASDYPWTKEVPGYGPQLQLVDHFLPNLSPEERAAIMGNSAARLFGL